MTSTDRMRQELANNTSMVPVTGPRTKFWDALVILYISPSHLMAVSCHPSNWLLVNATVVSKTHAADTEASDW